jgi:hypothetical protein
VPNTEFEGGDDGHGYDDHTFLVKQAQPSHIIFCELAKALPVVTAVACFLSTQNMGS